MNQSRIALILLGSVLLIVISLIAISIYLSLSDTAPRLETVQLSPGDHLPAGEPSLLTPLPTVVVSTLLEAGDPPPISNIHSHIVKPGETLYQISRHYGLSVDQIVAANGLVEPDSLFAGQELEIPFDPGATTGANTLFASPISPLGPTDAPNPTPTPNPTATLRPTETPLPTPTSLQIVNGLSLGTYLVMPEDVAANARSIVARGRELGRDPQAYSKVGDSTIENPHFMTCFDEGSYKLGEYGHLQEVIDFYAGSHLRQGMAVKRGFHSWTINDPLWADKENCQPNETPIACEIRLHNPSVMIFRLGSNDRGVPAGFDQNLRQAVAYAIEKGVLPILGTKADRFEGSNINNELIRQAAADFLVPLWDFDRVAQTIPGRGLQEDGVHLTIYYAHDYTSSTAYQRGHSLHNLTALLVLDAVWRELIQASG